MARRIRSRKELLSAARRLGIEADYVDARGRRRKVADATLAAVITRLDAGASLAVPAPPTEIAATPDHPAIPPQAHAGPAGRGWMLAAQLYGVRSQRNWGHGDFTDLLALIELAAEVGAAGVGVNPLHALLDDAPDRPSPYSPNSRLFLNPLYIDADAIADFAACCTPEIAATAETLRRGNLVDYPGVAALKQRSLRLAHREFMRHAATERRDDFAAFCRARQPALAQFAAFEVLRRRLARPWWEWLAEWQHPDNAAIARLRAESGDELGFYEYVQWIADRQLARCRDRARELGLAVGLYLDVAVGVQAGGFDAWHARDAMVRTLSVGAPPDPLNAAGQDWGLVGFSGVGLQASGFAAFREMLRAAMRYAGAVRIDHVLGLNRLYLIPDGTPPDRGAYVRMPFRQLLDVTARESAAHRCIVIGEDLGTVPQGFRQEVARFGIWSYKVMMFERDADGAFHPPEHYAERALATFATHDLPTFAGWMTAHDLAVRRALKLPAGETQRQRRDAIRALGEALHARGDQPDFPSVVRFLADSPAKLVAVALEDVLGERDQVNIPGTIDAHPNWRRKLPVAVERLAEHAMLREIGRIAAEHGRSGQSVAAAPRVSPPPVPSASR